MELVFDARDNGGEVVMEAGASLGAILTGFLKNGKVAAAIEDVMGGETAIGRTAV